MQGVLQWYFGGLVQLTCMSWAMLIRGWGRLTTKHAWSCWAYRVENTWGRIRSGRRFCVSLFQDFLSVRFIRVSAIFKAFSVLWAENIQRYQIRPPNHPWAQIRVFLAWISKMMSYRESLHKTSPCLKADRFTRYNFVAYDKLKIGLRHELFLVNQTYNSLTIVVWALSHVVGLS